jgi:hypothetical protein
MTSRRQFITAGAAVSRFMASRMRAARTTTSSGYPFSDSEARIARRDFRDMTKDILPTPCMLVDLDRFNANIKHMADTAKANGINVRPHVKIHKSVDVANHQMAQGPVGLTVATIAEAELFSGAGIQGILCNKQPVGVNNIQWAVALSKKDPTFMLVTDDAQVVDWLEEAAAAQKAQLRVLASVYAGMARQGIDGGEPALELGKRSPHPSACSLRVLWPIPEAPRTPRASKKEERRKKKKVHGDSRPGAREHGFS